MIQRSAYKYLLNWKEQQRRKPLIMRGARQTGKTYLVKQLGKTFENFIVLNCEVNNEIKKIFTKDLSITRIVRDLALFTSQEIIAGKTLLFFDEVQETPEIIQALRYFYEEMPDLYVIAAGSLLDFTLENIGVPVGRVSFLYLYPVSFFEFLTATGNSTLAEEILQHQPNEPLSEPIHNKLLDILTIYFAVGGMPEAVQCWIDTQSLAACSNIHHELINAYRQDFQKYAKKFQIKYINLLFDRIPLYQGNQFKFSNISIDYRKRELMPCLELLIKAQVVHLVTHSAGNGVPLGAEIDPDKFKVIFLDIALTQAILGLKSADWLLNPQETYVNRGAIVEAFIGQELLAYSACDMQPNLYYWQRETRNSAAEIDYLIEKNSSVIPVEVKSGSTGRLRSLHLFLQDKIKSPYGLRFYTHNYSKIDKIYSYPLYAVTVAMKNLST